ncbi:hypothetical protein [Thalassobacillus hwangdonensis]|uniref:LysM domain-containing protein n=1 Tax=Thalassobacillus hwangdonensis TaxID=546108 RepID=A0ABW3KY04_9BACI
MIKKLFLTVLVLLLFMSVYKDLTTGTTIQSNTEVTPSESAPSEPAEPPTPPPQPDTRFSKYATITVEPGDTVLSILEEIHDGSYHHGIGEMLEDFEKLNPGTDPSAIKIDEAYRFPVYELPDSQ